MYVLERVVLCLFPSLNYCDDTPPTVGNLYMIVGMTVGKAVTVAYGVPHSQHNKDNDNKYTPTECAAACTILAPVMVSGRC